MNLGTITLSSITKPLSPLQLLIARYLIPIKLYSNLSSERHFSATLKVFAFGNYWFICFNASRRRLWLERVIAFCAGIMGHRA